jgi:hypothetical protein
VKWSVLALTLAIAAITISGLATVGPLLSDWATGYGLAP